MTPSDFELNRRPRFAKTDAYHFATSAKNALHYQLAADAELAAVRSGNRSLEEIGWPGKNGRIKR